MRKPRSIALGQTLDLPDGSYTLVDYSNGVFRLREHMTEGYRLISHLELSAQLPPGEQLDTKKANTATFTETMDALNPAERALLPHIQELVDGSNPLGGEPRDQYAPHLPLTWRLDSKEAELAAVGITATAKSLKNKVLAYRKVGPAALIDGRRGRQEKALSRVDDKVKEALAAVIASYEGRSSPTYTKLATDLNELLITRFPDPAERPKKPSVRSIERYVKQLAGNQDPTLAASKREKSALAPTRQHQARLVTAPGDEAQIDSTVFDVLVRFPDGRVGRPTLTILVDKRTRSIIGHNFTDGPATGLDHVQLLARTLVPRPLRSWSSYYDTHNLPLMPWSAYLTDEQLERYDAHRPYIVPLRILTDNGQDFRGKTFEGACNTFGISVTQAPVKAPTSKAQVERTFGVINQMFAQHLPGYVQSNVAARGSKVAGEKVLDLATVAELFDRWVAVVWQNRKHDSLVDHYRPSERHTPNTAYAASVPLVGVFPLAFEEPDFIALMPSVTRTVQTDGIEFKGRMYDSAHLAPFRLQRTRTGAPVQVKVFYDPTEPVRVWVRAETGEWVSCLWSEERGRSRPMEDDIRESSAKLTAVNGGFRNDQAADLTIQMRKDVIAEAQNAAETTATPTTRRAHRTARRSTPLVDVQASAEPNPDEAMDFDDLNVTDG